MKSQNQPSELRDFNFRDCHLNERAALRGCVCMIVLTPSNRFQIEARSKELTNCCSNFIDTGYSSLLRCEGEIRFIRTSPFLLASGDKLHFFSEDARSSRIGNTGPLESRTPSACPTFVDEVGHTISWLTLAKKRHPSHTTWVATRLTTPHQGPLALVRVRIRVGINFRGWKFS